MKDEDVDQRYAAAYHAGHPFAAGFFSTLARDRKCPRQSGGPT
jgi:hypothetical protein